MPTSHAGKVIAVTAFLTVIVFTTIIMISLVVHFGVVAGLVLTAMIGFPVTAIAVAVAMGMAAGRKLRQIGGIINRQSKNQ